MISLKKEHTQGSRDWKKLIVCCGWQVGHVAEEEADDIE